MILHKMHTKLENGIVQYSLSNNQEIIDINALLGKLISLEFTGNIFCCSCGKKTYKSFSQGYCYNCFTTSPETEDCVLRPELCRAHEGIARDMEYAESHCLIPHYVYIAESSGIKVGITRNTQIPTRWIDQGAIQATIIAEVPNRFTAGIFEVHLKQYFDDKTNWRKMLTKNTPEQDLSVIFEDIAQKKSAHFSEYLRTSCETTIIQYPIIENLAKVNSISFDKTQNIEGTLIGIKGQYLLFSNGNVLNIRKHTGYEIRFSHCL